MGSEGSLPEPAGLLERGDELAAVDAAVVAAKNGAGLVFLAADVTTVDGTSRAKGAVWVAKDDKGTGVAALTDSAKQESSLPDATTVYKVSANDPAAAKAKACSLSG